MKWQFLILSTLSISPLSSAQVGTFGPPNIADLRNEALPKKPKLPPCDCSTKVNYNRFQKPDPEHKGLFGICHPGSPTKNNPFACTTDHQNISNVYEDGEAVLVQFDGRFEINPGTYETKSPYPALNSWRNGCCLCLVESGLQGLGISACRKNINHYQCRYTFLDFASPRPSNDKIANWAKENNCGDKMDYLHSGHSYKWTAIETGLTTYNVLHKQGLAPSNYNMSYGGCKITEDPQVLTKVMREELCKAAATKSCPLTMKLSGNQDTDPIEPQWNCTQMQIICSCALRNGKPTVTCTQKYFSCHKAGTGFRMTGGSDTLKWTCMGPDSTRLYSQTATLKPNSDQYVWNEPEKTKESTTNTTKPLPCDEVLKPPFTPKPSGTLTPPTNHSDSTTPTIIPHQTDIPSPPARPAADTSSGGSSPLH